MGYIGSELVRQLVARGEKVVVFDISDNAYRIEDIAKKVKVVICDLGKFSEVLNVIKNNRIDAIYHLGSWLTYMSELNPWESIQSNVFGTYHILEAARLLGVSRVMFTSTLGTYGLGQEGVLTDASLQRPTTLYGCGKLYGEGLGRWYAAKFGLDFRALRYAHMIGPNVRTPGHWAPPMIEDALTGKKTNKCIYGGPNTPISVIYVTDAAKAAIGLLDAPKKAIKTMNYNVTGIPDVIQAREVEAYLKKRIPSFSVKYVKDPLEKETKRQAGMFTRFDDRTARTEWGWSPDLTSLEAVVDRFQQDLKDHPARYGIVTGANPKQGKVR